MALRLEVKSLTDTNTLFFLSLPLSSALCFVFQAPSRCCPCVMPVPEWHLSRCSTVPSLPMEPRNFQDLSCDCSRKKCPVSAAATASPAAINLVGETSVMFESNFVSSFINQVSAEWLLPGAELCKRHEGLASLLGGKKWGKRNGFFPWKTEEGISTYC